MHFEQRKHNKPYYETVTRKKFGFATDIKTNESVNTLSLLYYVFLHAVSNNHKADFYLAYKDPIKLMISTHMFNLGKSQRWLASSTLQPIYSPGKSTDINSTGRWVSPRTNLDLVANKIFCLCQKSNPSCPAPHSPSIYWDNLVCSNLIGEIGVIICSECGVRNQTLDV